MGLAYTQYQVKKHFLGAFDSPRIRVSVFQKMNVLTYVVEFEGILARSVDGKYCHGPS